MNPAEDYRKAYHEVVRSTLQLCREYYGDRLVSLVLFGSVAKDTFTWESDIDILIVARKLPNGRYSRVMEFQKNVESKMEQTLLALFRRGIYTDLSPIFKTKEEDYSDDLPSEIRPRLSALAELSKWLRKEREISFYGDIDFIPTEEYRKEDASRALEGAKTVVEIASIVVK